MITTPCFTWHDGFGPQNREHTGEIPGFTANFRCRKLLYYEHCTDVLGYNRAGKAAQELVEEEEGRR